jgi:hypothetical protein
MREDNFRMFESKVLGKMFGPEINFIYAGDLSSIVREMKSWGL